jgi:capsular exopolysaccharide synthesis family protein
VVGIVASAQKPVYEARGKLLFRKKDASLSLLTAREYGQQAVGELESLNSLNTPVDTQAEILRSTPLLTATIHQLRLVDDQGKPLEPGQLLPNLTIKSIPGTDILQIGYKSPNPNQASAVINTLMKEYLDYSLDLNRAEATAARQFITQRMPIVDANLRQMETQLQDFKSRNNVIDLKEEAASTVTSFADLRKQATTLRTALSEANAKSSALQSRLGLSPGDALALNAVSQSPGVQQVLTEYRTVETQLSTQRSRYKGFHPEILALERRQANLQELLQARVGQVLRDQAQVMPLGENLQLGALREKLVEELVGIEVNRQGLLNQLQELAQTRISYSQRANALPTLERMQRELERQVQVAQSEYDALSKRLQEVTIAEQENIGNALIVSTAMVPKQASSLRKLVILGAGGGFGSLMALMTVFLLELQDPRLKTVREIRKRFPYPVLGILPVIKKHRLPFQRQRSDILLLHNEVDAAASQPYSMLQAKLKFLNPGEAVRNVVVSSAVAREGKSTVSANLAIATARAGGRVLIVDADLHHPVQHALWGISNDIGLHSIVTGEAEWEQVITTVMPNIDLITAGSSPYNSLSIIGSPEMNRLLQAIKSAYDLVILDAPPLLVADASVLSQSADGLVLVARPGVLDVVSANTAQESLEHFGQHVLGLVINGVSSDGDADHYFKHVTSYYHQRSQDMAYTGSPLSQV